MVTSVEESSFPLPTQNPVEGSFGGERVLQGLCGRGRAPTGVSSHIAFAIPSSQLLASYRQHHLRGGQACRLTDHRSPYSLPGWTERQAKGKAEEHMLVGSPLYDNHHVTWKLRYLQLFSSVSIPQGHILRLANSHSFNKY